jgi:hypothetical protein
MTQLLPLFARHETFHPRVGWLTKAVEAAARNPSVFADEQAPVELGVGKNMVRAMRYWGIATKVLSERPETSSRSVPVVPSTLGRLLLGPSGWDRFIEDPRTLWILHWHLLRTPVTAPVWWWVFEEFDGIEFEPADLERFVVDCLLEQGWSEPASSSISKDVDCLIRMYGRRTSRVAGDWLDSPFATLGLLEAASGASRRWSFGIGEKETLEPAVIAYACLDAMAAWGESARTSSLARLATAPGSPGRAFRIPESVIASALRQASRDHPQLTVAAPAGMTQLLVSGEPSQLAREVFAQAYGRHLRDVEAAEMASGVDRPLGGIANVA